MRESTYQARLIKELKLLFPGCVVLKNDADYIQGFPDLTVLWYDNWAVLEVKPSLTARRQPNQEFYVAELDKMCFAAFICPENEAEVLDALQRSFQTRRPSRVSKR